MCARCATDARASPTLRYPALVNDLTTDDRLLAAAATGDVAGIQGCHRRRGGCGRSRRDRYATPLLIATQARQTEAFRALIEAGADVDLQDDRLDNPFLYAGAEGILDILKLANEAGADPALTNRYGGVALIPASERGHVRNRPLPVDARRTSMSIT